jgi:hypothetical protein
MCCHGNVLCAEVEKCEETLDVKNSLRGWCSRELLTVGREEVYAQLVNALKLLVWKCHKKVR